MLLIRPSDLRERVDPRTVIAIRDLMTPPEIVNAETFQFEPEVISPTTAPDAAALLRRRADVRNLTLLPVKEHVMHETYNSQRNDPRLVEEIIDYLGGEPYAIADNKFPYRLPPGIEQYIVWINPQRNAGGVDFFMAECLSHFNLTTDSLILFERSSKTSMKLFKGTFKSFHHIHFWINT